VESGVGGDCAEILGLKTRSVVDAAAARWEMLPLWVKVKLVHIALCWPKMVNPQCSWWQPQN
jgi:hypothetical protein